MSVISNPNAVPLSPGGRESASCLPPVCQLSATCLPAVCHLSATCLPPVCHLSASCLPAVCHLSASSHDWILVDLSSGREDVSAELGQDDDGHHTHHQPVHQQQVQHPRSQGHHTYTHTYTCKHTGPKYFAMVQCFVSCAISVSINLWFLPGFFFPGWNTRCLGWSVGWAGETWHLCGKVNFYYGGQLFFDNDRC